MAFAFLQNVNAFQGSWTSNTRHDLNGISEVGTTYITGGNHATTITLQNYYSNGKMYGGKTVGCRKDQMVSHKAWGFDRIRKYGRVTVNAGIHHNPWFDV